MVNTPWPFLAAGIMPPTVAYTEPEPVHARRTVFACAYTRSFVLLSEWEQGRERHAVAVRFTDAESLIELASRRSFTLLNLAPSDFGDVLELLGIWSQYGSGCTPLIHYLKHPAVRSRRLYKKWRPEFMAPDGEIENEKIRQLKYYLTPIKTENEPENGEGGEE